MPLCPEDIQINFNTNKNPIHTDNLFHEYLEIHNGVFISSFKFN